MKNMILLPGLLIAMKVLIISSSLDSKKSTSFTKRSTREAISQLLFVF
jgi:hypothetical protein